MFSIIFLLGSELAYSSQGCGTLLYAKQLKEAESLLTHSVAFVPPVGELPTRNGTYECVRLSFQIDESGRAVSVKVEESSMWGFFGLTALKTLGQFRFRPSLDKSKRFMLVFDGMDNRWPSPPPDVK